LRAELRAVGDDGLTLSALSRDSGYARVQIDSPKVVTTASLSPGLLNPYLRLNSGRMLDEIRRALLT
jgi:hypothetical protein